MDVTTEQITQTQALPDTVETTVQAVTPPKQATLASQVVSAVSIDSRLSAIEKQLPYIGRTQLVMAGMLALILTELGVILGLLVR